MSLTPADVLGRITVVTGPVEFLAERVIAGVKAAVRAHDPEAELSETTADQLTMATLGELSAPSLFSSTRCVVVRRLEELPEESVAGLVGYAAQPADDIALVLVHSGGARGSGVLTRLRKAASVREERLVAPKAHEFAGFVAKEMRLHRVGIDRDAADLLVQSVGQDLRALSAAVSQLVNDFDATSVTAEMVRKYFGGRAEAKSFTVADLTLEGRTAQALEELRWALDRGTAPVLVTSAMAGGLRALAKVQSARPGTRDADLARAAGVPPWKLRFLVPVARGWDSDGLASAIQAVARADADVKGRASDASYALERMVISVAGFRATRARA